VRRERWLRLPLRTRGASFVTASIFSEAIYYIPVAVGTNLHTSKSVPFPTSQILLRPLILQPRTFRHFHGTGTNFRYLESSPWVVFQAMDYLHALRRTDDDPGLRILHFAQPSHNLSFRNLIWFGYLVFQSLSPTRLTRVGKRHRYSSIVSLCLNFRPARSAERNLN